MAGKRILNDFHGKPRKIFLEDEVALTSLFFLGYLGLEGFNQIFVDQMNPDIVGITRQNPITHESFILIAHTAFSYPNENSGPTAVRPLIFEGKLEEIFFELEFHNSKDQKFSRPSEFQKDPKFINGLHEYETIVRKNIKLEDSNIFSRSAKILGDSTQLDFINLRPGSVVAIRVSPHASVGENLRKLHGVINEFHSEHGPSYQNCQSIISKLNLVDLNLVLFSCNQEEQDRGFGFGSYDIPGFKRLEYAGFQGVLSLLSHISPSNDLGHPLCGNLRNGDWLIGEHNDLIVTFPTILVS